MIVIPTGTDAPIYYRPYATVALIVLNVALLIAVPPVAGIVRLDENDEVIEDVETVSNFERYSLALGDGRLHPVQWVTHNFLHYGFLHLAGNMLFLWAFGIVVEGKLGGREVSAGVPGDWHAGRRIGADVVPTLGSGRARGGGLGHRLRAARGLHGLGAKERLEHEKLVLRSSLKAGARARSWNDDRADPSIRRGIHGRRRPGATISLGWLRCPGSN